jgi:hypothetical protein
MHHAGGHVVRPEACIAVTQGRIDDPNLFHAWPPIETLSFLNHYLRNSDKTREDKNDS